MGFRLTPRSMTLDDLELMWGRILSEFRVISRVWGGGYNIWNIVVRQMALPAFQWDRTTQCCRAFTLALARLSCWNRQPISYSISTSCRKAAKLPLLRHCCWCGWGLKQLWRADIWATHCSRIKTRIADRDEGGRHSRGAMGGNSLHCSLGVSRHLITSSIYCSESPDPLQLV